MSSWHAAARAADVRGAGATTTPAAERVRSSDRRFRRQSAASPPTRTPETARLRARSSGTRRALSSRVSTRRGTLGAMDVVTDPFAPAPPPGQDELPSEDGEPMDTPRHRDQMMLLIESLTEGWRDRRDYYVGGNMFVYFSELQSRGEKFRGPDVFVVLDSDRDKERKSWVAWQEGGRLPDVVIELLSESTEHVDRGEKKRIYERIWRTGHYVLYDPHTHALEGFELVRGKYVPLAPDAHGHLPIASMGLALGLGPATFAGQDGSWLRWFDATGNAVPTPAEAADARSQAERTRADAERARADAERDRAEAAERRAAELEAALRGRR